MKRCSLGFLLLLVKLSLWLSFAGTPVSTRGRQVPALPSRAGVYEGQMVKCAPNPVDDQGIPASRVVLEFIDDGAGGYTVRGAAFSMVTEPPALHARLDGRFVGGANRFEAGLKFRWLDDSNSSRFEFIQHGFQGGFEKDSFGDEFLSVLSTPAGEYGIILFRQAKPPPEISQGSLTIESAVAEPAETEPGKPVILRYEYRATDILNTAVEVRESLIITGPEGSPSETKGTLRLTDFQHRDGFRMDGHGTCERTVTASRPGSYKCRIEITADGYSTAAVREVGFTVKRETPPGGRGATTGAGAGAAAIPTGTPVWVLKKVDIDPVKMAEKDAKNPCGRGSSGRCPATARPPSFRPPSATPTMARG